MELTTQNDIQMSSLDFLNQYINPAREAAGQSTHANTKFLQKVEDELDLDVTGKKFQLGKTGHQVAYYDLNYDQMMLVGMRESKAVRKSVLNQLKMLQQQAHPITAMTPAEMMLQNAEIMVQHERKLDNLDNRLSVLETIAAPKREDVVPTEYKLPAYTHEKMMKEPRIHVYIGENVVNNACKENLAGRVFNVPDRNGNIVPKTHYIAKDMSSLVLDILFNSTPISAGAVTHSHPKLKDNFYLRPKP